MGLAMRGSCHFPRRDSAFVRAISGRRLPRHRGTLAGGRTANFLNFRPPQPLSGRGGALDLAGTGGAFGVTLV